MTTYTEAIALVEAENHLQSLIDAEMNLREIDTQSARAEWRYSNQFEKPNGRFGSYDYMFKFEEREYSSFGQSKNNAHYNEQSSYDRLALKCNRQIERPSHFLFERLHSAAQSVKRALPTGKPTLKVLAGIHLQSRNNRLYLTTTNLEIGIRSSIGYKGPYVNTVVVDGKMFAESISQMTHSATGCMIETSDRLSVSTKNNRQKFSMKVLPNSEYPAFMTDNARQIGVIADIASFTKIASAAIANTCKENNRPILTGVLFEFEDKCTVVAADGYKLYLKDTPFEVEHKTEFILGAKALKAALAALPADMPVTLSEAATAVIFSAGDTEIIVQKMEGKFPDWRSLMPTLCNASIPFDLDQLLSSLKLLKVSSGKATKHDPIIVTIATDPGAAFQEFSEYTLSAMGHTAKLTTAYVDCPVDVRLELERLYTIVYDLAKTSSKPTKKNGNARRILTIEVSASMITLLHNEQEQLLMFAHKEEKSPKF